MTIVGRPKKDKSLRILCIFVLIRISVTSRFPFWQLRPRSDYLHRNDRDVAINGALCRSGQRQIIGKPIVKFPDLTRGCPKKDCFKLFLRVVVEQAMQWVDRVPIWLPAVGGLGNQTMQWETSATRKNECFCCWFVLLLAQPLVAEVSHRNWLLDHKSSTKIKANFFWDTLYFEWLKRNFICNLFELLNSSSTMSMSMSV